MTLPKLCLLDRDSTLCFASKDPSSPLYYITRPDHLILKPGVREAIQLIRALNIPMILVTKQRCVGKGLVTESQVKAIHDHLESLLGVEFEGICVEGSAPDKGALYHAILNNYPVCSEEVVLFDDSIDEREIATRMGIHARDGTDLLGAVTKAFDL